MARITSLNMLLESTGKDYLAELYGKVIENVMKNLASADMKNQDLSGDPASGSVEAKRFVNAQSQTYGTARTAGKGNGVKVRPVTVTVDTDKEIVEELEAKDTTLYGVDGLLDRRARNHVTRMASELDTEFFAEAGTAGSLVTPTGTTIEEKLEEMIQSVETVKNNFVDGVPRDMISLVLAPQVYGAIRTALDKTFTANINSTAEEIVTWHGVKVKSSTHLPSGVTAIAMADGSVAQPIMADAYTAEKVPLSNAYAVSLFYHYGTKAVTPDLIFKANI